MEIVLSPLSTESGKKLTSKCNFFWKGSKLKKKLRMQAMHLYDKCQNRFYNGRPSWRKNEKYLREKARMQAVHLYDKMQITLLHRQAELKKTINLKNMFLRKNE